MVVPPACTPVDHPQRTPSPGDLHLFLGGGGGGRGGEGDGDTVSPEFIVLILCRPRSTNT